MSVVLFSMSCVRWPWRRSRRPLAARRMGMRSPQTMACASLPTRPCAWPWRPNELSGRMAAYGPRRGRSLSRERSAGWFPKESRTAWRIARTQGRCLGPELFRARGRDGGRPGRAQARCVQETAKWCMMMELHQKLRTHRWGPLAGRCLLAGPFMWGDGQALPMRETPGRAFVCHGHGPELVVHSLKALPSLACEARKPG